MIGADKDPYVQPISVKEMALPKGGGAMRGLGDAFGPNLFSGTGNYTIPIPVTPARGLEPQLTLNYNSGSGNSEFGLGFSVSIPQISVNTNRGIPRYEANDYYNLDGEGELVRTEQTTKVEGCLVTVYLPRLQAAYSKIEHWKDSTTGIVFWKVISRNNITTVFGKTANARIASPTDDTWIYQWLAEEMYDAKGNKILFTYKEENGDNVPAVIYEKDRSNTANRYIGSIQYGNFFDETGAEQFAFELIFDYGEYDLSDLKQPGCQPYVPVRKWSCRPDPFSSYRSGFEIRTYRLCQNILLFHNFVKETGAHCLVKRMALDYNHLQGYALLQQLNGMSLMSQVVSVGYRKNEDGSYREQQLPPLVFTYSGFNPPASPEFKILDAGGNTIPGYLDAGQFLPVDLHGDGLPGFLLSNSAATLYFEPVGEGKYLPAASCNSFPVNRDLQNAQASLVDLEGNGQLELLVSNGKQAGYYPYSDKTGWGNFQSFSGYPLVIDPATEMADLDANGKTDMVLTSQTDLLIYYSKGKFGYDSPATVQRVNDFPLKVEEDAGEQVTFIDIFGDGLAHRVKIRNGLVECWPNLGRGRFGEKVTLDNAPVYDGVLDNTRLFFADIDGSGTTDFIYVYPDSATIFINQNGNSFADPIQIILPELFTPIDQISFADILGNGTSCLVFTKAAPVARHYYYNFSGEMIYGNGDILPVMKPYLLIEADNNMGLVNQFQYCSSTKFALEDKAAGKPWVTRLRFPVQVVEKTVTLDQLSGSRYTTLYKYHDGFYDPVEKEFNGFGFVESWDTETLEQFQQSKSSTLFPVNDINQELYIPPVYTKTWYYTGAFEAQEDILASYHADFFNGDSHALHFPKSIFADDIYTASEATFRQAYGALKGRLLRKEVYAADATPLANNPYTVEESNYCVELIQEANVDTYGVFTVSPRENIKYSYERNPDDPMIVQEFVLATDPLCGETEISCSVFLPRRNAVNADVQVYPEQQQLRVTANTFLYFNAGNEDSFWLRGIMYDARQLELSGCTLSSGSAYFSYDTIKDQVLQALQHAIPYQEVQVADILQARQYAWVRLYFWNEVQGDVLPLGQVGARALLHHQSTAAFTKNNIVQIFGEKVTDDMIQEQGGYYFDDDMGYWCNRGLVQHYFKTFNCFYQPAQTENTYASPSSSLYQKTVVEYDPYYFIPVSSTQYIDDTTVNVVRALVDYTVLQPYQLVDINNNVSQVLFDCLGQVIVTSLFGTENDVPTGGMRLYKYLSQDAEYIPRYTTAGGHPITWDDILADTVYYLQGAASYFFYDLDAFTRITDDPQPVNAVNLLRENYYHAGGITSNFSCQTFIEYQDGLGRSIAKKQLVNPATTGAAADEQRWLVSGRTVYNNKGKVCEEYFPYFSNTPLYETQDEIVFEGLTPPPTVSHYDPLLRVIRIDSPKGFFAKVNFTPWEVVSFDEDDTVKDARYYIAFMASYPAQPTQEQQDEKDALDKAAVFYNTPDITVMDNTGCPFLYIRSLTDRLQTSYQETDIQGRIVTSIDARLYQSNVSRGSTYYNFKYAYPMGEEKAWYTDSADAGVSMYLNNIFGNPVQAWNANGDAIITGYDRLQRPLTTEVVLSDGSGRYVAERAVYGESVQVDYKNLRGQLYQKFDQAGISFNLSCSMQGMPLAASRQVTAAYKTAIDWLDPSKVDMAQEVYLIDYTYDALKRLLSETTPDGTTTSRTYNPAGVLSTVALLYKDNTQQPVINSIDYNANLQRTSVLYQNGVKTSYTYEDTTQRLMGIHSVRPGTDKPVLQDIRYVYDPAGNITRTRDSSFEVVFCNNQMVEPLQDYTYDAIYQLLQASGRQHKGIDQSTHINGFKQSIYTDSCPPDLNDAGKLENYTEKYSYDDGGNLISKQHIATSASWTETTPVAANSNRLAGVAYDAAGNMQSLKLKNAVPLTWDYRNVLISAGIIQRSDEDDDRDYYNYDGNSARIRKVCERLANGGDVVNIEEKIYLGSYEIKRVKTVSSSGEKVVLHRQCLRVMDNDTCVVTVFYWITDDGKREVDSPGTRSVRYQLTNNLGSVSMEVDATAQLISYEEYFPYGGTSFIAGRNQQEVQLKDYRYSGKECDDTTGLYYYGARYYISWLGRWLNPDPSGTTDGLNLFRFVKSNPITFVDTNGMISLLATKIAIGAAFFFSAVIGPVWGAIAGGMSGAKAFEHPAAKVAGAIGGAIGGLVTGAVLGVVNTIAAPFRAIYDIILHNYRKYAPDATGQSPALLYPATQHTEVGINLETGRAGAELLAEQYGIPRALWPDLVKPYTDPNLDSITNSAHFNGTLVMVGHGSRGGRLEVDDALASETGQQVYNRLQAQQLDLGAINRIDMSICYGSAFSVGNGGMNGFHEAFSNAGQEVTIRSSDSSVSPIGNLHAMGQIREESSPFKEFLHWMTFGLVGGETVDSVDANVHSGNVVTRSTWNSTRN